MAFVKIYREITDSTIWETDLHVRVCWIALLAHADPKGIVYGSVGAIARMANLSRELAEDALRVLSAPDPESTSSAEQGSRLVRLEGNNWQIVNYRTYRERRDADHQREVTRQRVERWREGKQTNEGAKVPDPVTICNAGNAKKRREERGEKGNKDRGADAPGATFEDFYRSYPRHDAREDAEKAWKKLSQAERLECVGKTLTWVKAKAGTERQFLPLPATFLNGRRWRDELQEPTEKVASLGPPADVWCSSCHAQAKARGSNLCSHCLEGGDLAASRGAA